MLTLFLPGKTGSKPQHLVDVGLESFTMDGRAMFADAIGNNPAKSQSGVFVWFGDPLPQPYRPAKQTWHTAPPDPQRNLPAGRYWFCLGDDTRPEAFARPKQYRSQLVDLDDGHAWQMPIAVDLPHESQIDPDSGQILRRVGAEFAAYYRLAEQFMHLYANLGEAHETVPDLKVADAWRCAVLGLEINYYVSRDILSALGAIRRDPTLFWLVGASWELQAFLDHNQARASEKKTPGGIPAGSNS